MALEAGEQGTLAEIRVLMVEDHRLFADVLRAALSDEGINVVEVTPPGREGSMLPRAFGRTWCCWIWDSPTWTGSMWGGKSWLSSPIRR